MEMNFVLNYVMNLLRKSLLSVKGSVVMDDHVVMNWGSIKDRPYKIWCCFVVGNHHNSNFSFARWSKDTGSWPLLWMRSYPLTRIRLKLHWSTNKHLEAKLNVYIQGVPKKRPHVWIGHNSSKNGTRTKSRVSFEKFRKFFFWWALKFSNLDLWNLRKVGLKFLT